MVIEAAAAVVDDVEVAEAAGAAVELELLELPHAESTAAQVASAAIPKTRRFAVLRLAIMALPVSGLLEVR